MKKVLLIVLAALLLPGCKSYIEKDTAYDVIERTLGYRPDNIELRMTGETKDGTQRYSTEVKKGKLYIEGSSGVALCRGFYDYITSNGYGVVNWSGTRIELPETLPDSPKKKVVSPFRNRLYYNVCTFGYTTPFWGWEEWEKEIDWMALHGFDMPLAPIAGEAILARVWRRLGLTDEEIGELFTGPAHMPWMRMGNMSGLDGPPSQEWHEAQIELQHKVNDRMLSLDMNPIYQGFAGFVPPAIKKYYPEVNITETRWSGFKNWMLDPMDELFTTIGDLYIREWEAEFGKGIYYLIDSFNEMEIPFGEKGSKERYDGLKSYSETIYNSISLANPEAIWVMQGWMFGYHRNYWDPESVEALLSGAPDGKLMVIDLAVDFNHYVWRSEKSWDYLDGMYGKDWIYSTVPNFGGRSALTGALEFYANGHLEALASPNKGNLTGYGTSPEGIEQNDVIYELIADAAWSSERIDLDGWLHNYSVARYGKCPAEIDAFWTEMRKSSYDTFTNHARFKWQMRPFLHRKQMMGINEHYYNAIESFLACSDEMTGSVTYRTDAIMYAAFYLAAKAENLLDAINWAYVRGDRRAAAGYEERFINILRDCDRLLESHPVFRLERWMDLSQSAATGPAEARQFEREARRLISVWGGPSLSDYSPRVWSGFIRDFYIPRWQKYFEVKKNPQAFSFVDHDAVWVEAQGISKIEPYAGDEIIGKAGELVAGYSDISPAIIGAPENAIAFWSPFEFKAEETRFSTTIDREWLPYVKGIRITGVRGADPVTVSRIDITASRQTWGTVTPDIVVVPGATTTIPMDITVPEMLPAEVTITFRLKSRPNADSYAAIELDFGGDKPDNRPVTFK